MDVEIINCFLDSTINVLTTMAMIDAKPGKPQIKMESAAKGDVTGMIGIVGEGVKGSLAISFEEKTILHVVSQMFGEPITELDDSVNDAVGEITNIVTGGAKKTLSEKGYKFQMAIPTTIAGKQHVISHKSTGPIIIVPFNTEAGKFFIEICFEI